MVVDNWSETKAEENLLKIVSLISILARSTTWEASSYRKLINWSIVQTKTSKTVNRIRIVMESCFRRCHVRIINASAAGLLRKKHNRASLCVTLNHRETVDEKHLISQDRSLICYAWIGLNGHYKRGCFCEMLRERGKSSAGLLSLLSQTDRAAVSSRSKPKFRVNVGVLRGRLNVVRKLLSRRLSLHTRCPLRL